MIPSEKEFKLIQIYMYICDLYDKELKYYCQRYSNNSKPAFTDQEIMTIYLFAGHCQKYFQIRDIYNFASEYLSSWFPKLPSYQTFNLRLNRLGEAFRVLSDRLISSFMPDDCDNGVSLVDSMPVITCAGRNRKAKVAREITSKGYCSTKNQYYYGVKLHALTSRREATIPFPRSLMVTPAEDNDLFSTAVSKVRQPIESFFNWLNEKTTIQRAQKVRSTKGLLIHTMGKIAIAFIYLIF